MGGKSYIANCMFPFTHKGINHKHYTHDKICCFCSPIENNPEYTNDTTWGVCGCKCHLTGKFYLYPFQSVIHTLSKNGVFDNRYILDHYQNTFKDVGARKAVSGSPKKVEIMELHLRTEKKQEQNPLALSGLCVVNITWKHLSSGY